MKKIDKVTLAENLTFLRYDNGDCIVINQNNGDVFINTCYVVNLDKVLSFGFETITDAGATLFICRDRHSRIEIGYMSDALTLKYIVGYLNLKLSKFTI